jgi:hypothetical protein
MKIDANKIIEETISVFKNSGAAEYFKKCESKLEEADYREIHRMALTPTNIVINSDLFNNEIKQWSYLFEQWGNDHQHLPRYGLALVNQTGELITKDPINGSLMAWNRDNPTNPLIETDCRVPTDVMKLASLSPLNLFDGYWCRSNVFKWNEGAYFLPHIDTTVPSYWIRLWAATSPDIDVRFYNPDSGELESVPYEVGRVYVIDTSQVHDAYAKENNVHQLFLSVVPEAFPVVLSSLL